MYFSNKITCAKIFYKTEKNETKLLQLSKRANNSKLPSVEVIDLKKELATGNKSMLSEALYKSIKHNLENKYQSIYIFKTNLNICNTIILLFVHRSNNLWKRS